MSRRPGIFTEETFATIARDIAAGISSTEIAKRLGCTHGTLRVKCSYAKVSLRRTGVYRFRRGRHRPGTETALTMELPPEVVRELKRQSAARGISTGDLAGKLLAVVTADNLFNAVLDA
jgi:hypothetical protein